MFQISTYAVIERALAATYDVAQEDVPALRSRLGALQRGGLFGAARPGKGRKLAYGPDQFHRLVFALELTAFGIAPSLILELVESFWDSKLHSIFSAAEFSDHASHCRGRYRAGPHRRRSDVSLALQRCCPAGDLRAFA